MKTITMPATYSNWVFIPSKELNIERSMKVILTVQYEKETVERDEDGFTKKGRDDLERLLDETDQWIGVSKPYFNVDTLS